MKNKYKEIITYLIFGGLTTVINIIGYYLFTKIGIYYLISNLLAWVLAVLFAFITNRKYVFKSNSKYIFKELYLFVGSRIFSLVIDMLIMYIGIDLLNINDLLIKIFTNVIVIVINYLLSKFFIFRKEKEKENEVN